MNQVIAQRYDWDCGVASVAMLLDISYGDVSQVLRGINEIISDPRLKTRGIILRQMEVLLRAFGFTVKRHYRRKNPSEYLDGASGILGLVGGDCDPHGHWVALKDGLLLDPSGGEAWKWEDYLKETGCRPATLLSVE